MLDISDNLLRRLAGETAFHAGRSLVAQGAVRDWHANGSNVLATVIDDDVAYKARITHTANTLDGSCNCAVSDGIDFCAHSVALSITWRDWIDTRALAERGSDAERLRRYLHTLDHAALVDALIEVVESDSTLNQRWLLKADRALGTLTEKQLRKRINQLFTPQLRISAAITAVRECALLLEDIAEVIAAGQLAELAAYALQRIATHDQSDTIADATEDGIAQLQSLLVAAFRDSGWTIAMKTTFLLELITSSDTGLLPPLPESFFAEMAASDIAFVRQSITDAWEQARDNEDTREPILRDCVIRHARNTADTETLITVLSATASDVDDFLLLSQLSLDLEQPDLAQHWLQQARDAIRDHQDRRAVTAATIALHLYQNDRQAALDAQWSLFTATLQAADLEPLGNISDQAIDHWRRRGVAEIRRQIDAATKQRGQAILYERLAQFYYDTGDIDAASDIAVTHMLNSELLDQILQQQQDPGFTIPMSMRLARQWVESGDNRSYRKAVDALIGVYRKIEDPVYLRHFNDSLESLRQQLGSKRNFIKWLDDALRNA